MDRTVAPVRRGGKSELRRAVCRITSGIPASRLEDGQCHRKHTAFRLAGKVRVKRCGKSAPPGQQCPGQGKPHTEQDQIGRESASADTHRLGALEPSGRSQELGSDAGPRGMIVAPRKRNTEFGLQVHLSLLSWPRSPKKFRQLPSATEIQDELLTLNILAAHVSRHLGQNLRCTMRFQDTHSRPLWSSANQIPGARDRILGIAVTEFRP